MIPQSGMMLGASDTLPARYIGRASGSGSTGPLSDIGAKVGDLVIARAGEASAAGGGSGSWADLDYRFRWRILASITDPIIVQGGGGGVQVDAAVYRGPSSIAIRRGGSSNQPGPETLAGFVKAPNHAGLIALQQTFGVAGTSSDVTKPPTWRRRIAQTFGTSSNGHDTESYDRLQPENTEYLDGAVITWVPAVPYPEAYASITILELLNL